MHNDGMKVVFGSLAQVSQDMQAKVKEIEERLNVLEGELAPLQSDWKGSAQETYKRSKATWDRAMAEMSQLLKDASTSVERSSAEYLAADNRGAAGFQGIGGGSTYV